MVKKEINVVITVKRTLWIHSLVLLCCLTLFMYTKQSEASTSKELPASTWEKTFPEGDYVTTVFEANKSTFVQTDNGDDRPWNSLKSSNGSSIYSFKATTMDLFGSSYSFLTTTNGNTFWLKPSHVSNGTWKRSIVAIDPSGKQLWAHSFIESSKNARIYELKNSSLMVIIDLGGNPGKHLTKAYIYDQQGKLIKSKILNGFLETAEGGKIITVDGYSTNNQDYSVPVRVYSESLDLLYRFTPGLNFTISPEVTDDGIIYIYSTNSKKKIELIYALNDAGKTLWKKSLTYRQLKQLTHSKSKLILDMGNYISFYDKQGNRKNHKLSNTKRFTPISISPNKECILIHDSAKITSLNDNNLKTKYEFTVDPEEDYYSGNNNVFYSGFENILKKYEVK